MRVDICISREIEPVLRLEDLSERSDEHDALREAAILELRPDRPLDIDGWASRSWDGPCANFPGYAPDDSGRPRRTTHH